MNSIDTLAKLEKKKISVTTEIERINRSKYKLNLAQDFDNYFVCERKLENAKRLLNEIIDIQSMIFKYDCKFVSASKLYQSQNSSDFYDLEYNGEF